MGRVIEEEVIDGLAGIWVPLPVPIDGGGDVDLEAVATTLTLIAESDVTGVASSASGGGAGEYADLSTAEWSPLAEHIASVAADLDLPVAVGVGHADASEMLARAEHAARLDPAAVLMPAGEDLAPLVGELAARAPDTPLLLVEPPHDDLFTPRVIEAMGQAAPNLAGLVLSERGEAGYEDLRRFEEELALWAPDTELATGYRHGATGSVSALSCWDPARAERWFEALESDMPAALAFELTWQRFVEDRLNPLRLRYRASRAALDKALAVAGDHWPLTTRMRWPNEAIPEPIAQGLGTHAAQAGLL